MTGESLLPLRLSILGVEEGKWLIHHPRGVYFQAGSEIANVLRSLSEASSIDVAWARYQGHSSALDREQFGIQASRCLDFYASAKPKSRSISWKMRLVPASVVQSMGGAIAPLFSRACAPFLWACTLLSVGGLVLLSLMHLGQNHGGIESADAVVVAILIALSVLIHEVSHAGALMARGAEPGEMGVALVRWVIPMFYTQLTHAWRLRSSDRIAVNTAGVQSQWLFAGLLWVFSAAFDSLSLSFESAALAIFYIATIQLIPFLRTDGYWVLADLLNEPHLGQFRWAEIIMGIREGGDSVAKRRCLFLGCYTAFNTIAYVYFIYTVIRHGGNLAVAILQWIDTGFRPDSIISLQTALTVISAWGLGYGLSHPIMFWLAKGVEPVRLTCHAKQLGER